MKEELLHIICEVMKDGKDGKPVLTTAYYQNIVLTNSNKNARERASDGALFFSDGILHKTVFVVKNGQYDQSNYEKLKKERMTAQEYWLVIKNLLNYEHKIIRNDDLMFFTSDKDSKERLIKPGKDSQKFYLRFPFEDKNKQEDLTPYEVLYQSKTKSLCEQYLTHFITPKGSSKQIDESEYHDIKESMNKTTEALTKFNEVLRKLQIGLQS